MVGVNRLQALEKNQEFNCGLEYLKENDPSCHVVNPIESYSNQQMSTASSDRTR